MSKPTLHTIDIEDLSVVTGGKPNPNPNPRPDFANRYSTNVSEDAKGFWNRANATADNLRSHQWGSAARNFGAEVLDEVGLIGDAIAPVRAIFG